MNNASKGRCVTVTPRGKARTKYLRQNPGFARGNIDAGNAGTLEAFGPPGEPHFPLDCS